MTDSAVEADEDELRAMDPRELTNVEAMGAWDAVLGDMDATATAYESEGWRAEVCHPGDVSVVGGEERTGVDVLLPDDEFAAVKALVEAAAFDEYEVLRAEREGLVYAVVVMQDTSEKLAFLYPIYFEPEPFDAVVEDGVTVYLRRLQGEYVKLELSDAGLFLMDEEE